MVIPDACLHPISMAGQTQPQPHDSRGHPRHGHCSCLSSQQQTRPVAHFVLPSVWCPVIIVPTYCDTGVWVCACFPVHVPRGIQTGRWGPEHARRLVTPQIGAGVQALVYTLPCSCMHSWNIRSMAYCSQPAITISDSTGPILSLKNPIYPHNTTLLQWDALLAATGRAAE